MKKELILIGGGGHCRSCIDVIEKENTYRIAGIVDKRGKVGTRVLAYEILASDEELDTLAGEHKTFFITIGQIKSGSKRKELFEKLKALGVEIPVIISPLADVSKHARIQEGTIVMHGAHVNAGAEIGKNCIINTCAIIEHDCKVGDHCHISTGSILNGECLVGEGAFIGSNCVLSNNIVIAGNSVIGAGSVVIRRIDEAGTYVGNPVRRIL
ncbi:MAG: acetyltransferase [Armatimonadetes bacterium]|nr:acetyltransferase [Armatimonadota bacterium]